MLAGRRSCSVAGAWKHLLFAGAVVFAPGCPYVGSNSEKPSTTTLTAARTASMAPPLAAFVVRVAEDEDALGPGPSRAVEQLVREVDESVRPVEDARVVFVEVLARALTEGRFEPAPAHVAADRVVRATEQAAPALRSAIERLHAVLVPRQRAALVEAVTARFDRWAHVWGDAPGSIDEHAWIGTFAGASPATSDVERDAVTTARRWTSRLVGDVARIAEHPTLDARARSELASHLRATGRLD